MIVKVYCGTVLGDEFAAMMKTVPQCTLKPSRPGLPRSLKVANSVGPRKKNGTERETPSFALGTDVNFTKVIFKPIVRLK